MMNPNRQRGHRKTKDPCPRCFLHLERCICAKIPHLNYATRLSLVVHFQELKRTTNTGRLAVEALSNSELIVRGKEVTPLDLSRLISNDYRTLLFFPSETAAELTTDFLRKDPRPIHLIVPDGNWRQASKVNTRHPELQDVPRVMIKAPNLATLRMRAETSLEGMATLQAIAEAFGVIEGPEAKKALMELYEAKLFATLQGRPPLPR